MVNKSSNNIPIDCFLNNLQHHPIFETTKQAIIQTIEEPLTSK
jgi:hypothetical protein